MDKNDPIYKAIDTGGGQTCDVDGVIRQLDRSGFAIVPKLLTDQILNGPPLDGADLVSRLERRLGSLKLVGERDDLLLDAAMFIHHHWWQAMTTDERNLHDLGSTVTYGMSAGSIFFPGAISGFWMSVGRLRDADKIQIGSDVRGCGVADGTKVVGQYSGSEGGPGTYRIEPPQTVSFCTLEVRSPR